MEDNVLVLEGCALSTWKQVIKMSATNSQKAQEEMVIIIISVCIYVYICIHICIHIYRYGERETEAERDKNTDRDETTVENVNN